MSKMRLKDAGYFGRRLDVFWVSSAAFRIVRAVNHEVNICVRVHVCCEISFSALTIFLSIYRLSRVCHL